MIKYVVRNRYLEGFARILPTLLILVSVAGLLIGGIVLERWDYSIRGLIVAIPAIIASIVLLYMFKRPIDDNEGVPLVLFNIKNAPYLLFILFYLISTIILLAGINRLLYFIFIASLYLTIFVQIFSQKVSSNVIVLEIVSVMANVIYGTTLVYPLFFRTTDILLHNTISTVTSLSGHTVPFDLDASYASFPLFHIYNAISSNILGLSAQDSHFIVMCPAYVIVVLFLFRLFKIFSNNEQVSLLACLCFSVSPTVLTRGIEMVTSVTAFVGFVILLYLIFAAKERGSIAFNVLIILSATFIMLVHQVSIAQIVLLVALLMACELLLGEKRYFSTYLILFITLSFSAYWIYSSRLFLDNLIGSRLGLNYLDIGGVQQTLIDPSLDQMQVAMIFLQDQMDMGIFLFFALIGTAYILYRQKPRYLPVVAIFSLFTLVLYVPNPLLTSQTFARIYRVDRFWILIAPFMAFFMASGFFWLSKWSQKHTIRWKVLNAVTVLLCVVFVLSSLQSPILDITSQEGRLYFTDEELSGYNYVTEKIHHGSELYSDYNTARFFYLDQFSLTDELGLSYYKSNILDGIKWSPQKNQYVIFRNAKFEDGKLQFESTGGFVNFVSNEENKRDFRQFYTTNSAIYSNDQISVIIGQL